MSAKDTLLFVNKQKKLHFPLSNEDRKLAEDLLEYVKNSHDTEIAEKYNLRPGIGLAAPQVNVSKRIFALHIAEIEGEAIKFCGNQSKNRQPLR